MSDIDIRAPSTKNLTNDCVVREIDFSDSEPSSSSDEDELDLLEKPPEYWHIQKMMKYVKAGNQTITLVALCCMLDHNLYTPSNQRSILDIGGLETLINILDTKDLKCRIGALSVLKCLTAKKEIKRQFVDMGGIELLVRNLAQPAVDLRTLVGDTVYNVADIRKGRGLFRQFGGIPYLVDSLDVKHYILNTHRDFLSREEQLEVTMVNSIVRALWALAQCQKNIHVMMKSGLVPILPKLIRCEHQNIVVATIGMLTLCARDQSYQLAIQTQGMIKDLTRNLNQDDENMKRYCAQTIMNCCEDPDSRELLRKCGGLEALIINVKDVNNRQNKFLFAALTGAIWKSSLNEKNINRYSQLKTVETLVQILADPNEDEQVLSNTVGALAEFVKWDENQYLLRRCGGIPYLITLLSDTYQPLLENIPKVLQECASDEDSMKIIEELDGVRLVYSLLKNENLDVKANAAKSLVPLVKHAHDSGEMVRSFVGGLELIVRLLQDNSDPHVLASVCAAISEIAKDIENLAIISDHGVVPILVNLMTTENEELQEQLCAAIAFCCPWCANCKQFGRLGAITPMVKFLSSDNRDVRRQAAVALLYLSTNSFNCITMHESGVVPFLLQAVGSTDVELQEASAGCLANMRKLVFEAETSHLIRTEKLDDSSVEEEETILEM